MLYDTIAHYTSLAVIPPFRSLVDKGSNTMMTANPFYQDYITSCPWPDR